MYREQNFRVKEKLEVETHINFNLDVTKDIFLHVLWLFGHRH